MTTIDQRILIPTPPEVVWEYISEIRNNPRWQAGCTGVNFLTSKVSGPGTRWRQTVEKSSEQVIEIAAWYEGLGYQYTYIDGMPFRDGIGRIRLQEIPEGTVVQWTITYEMGGLLGGMRSSLGLNRRLETMMVTSLKALWKQVNESGSAQRLREAKSLMRDAPDAEARANYKPRHVPVVDLRTEGDGEAAPPVTPVPAPAPLSELDGDAKYRPPAGYTIPEPPVAEDDTRPRQPVVSVESPAPSEPIRRRLSIHELVEDAEEPEFLQDMVRFAPPAVEPPGMDDTQPIRPVASAAPPGEPDILDAFTLEEADFAPSKSVEDNANVELERPEHTPQDTSLDAEIDALLAGPPAQEPARIPSITDEFEALLAEPETAAPGAKSITDEINALIAEPEASDEAASVSAAPAEAESFHFDDDVTGETVPAEPSSAALSSDETANEPTAPTPRIDESAFPPPSASDTSKMSIWEIFGVPRPSETAELSKVEAEALDVPTETAFPAAESEPEAEPAAEVTESPEPILATEIEPEARAETAPTAELAEAPADSPAEPDVLPASVAAVDDLPEPVLATPTATPDAAHTGDMMIVEVIREVNTSPHRTGLRLRQRSKLARVRRPQ